MSMCVASEGVKPPESGGQVATGTQTSPGPDAPKKAPAPPSASKGKKARYQLQQKATQAPPLAPDSSQSRFFHCFCISSLVEDLIFATFSLFIFTKLLIK